MNASSDRSLDSAPEGLPERGNALTGQFLVLAFAIMAIGMLSMSILMSWRIERSVMAGKAVSSTLLINNFMAPHLQELASADALSQKSIADLNAGMQESGLRAEVAAFRIWKQDGGIVYSDNEERIGQRNPQNSEVAKAWSGAVQIQLGSSSADEEDGEWTSDVPLIEVLAPISDTKTGVAYAVVELHEFAGGLEAELTKSKWQVWLAAALVTLNMMGFLLVIVTYNGRIIDRQRQALSERVTQLSELLRYNRTLQGRIEDAARRAAEDNEHLLRRMGYDLHDGVAQLIGLALLRLDRIKSLPQDESNLQKIQNALSDALSDVRSICKGLLLPEVQSLTLGESLVSMIRSHERRTGTTVSCSISELPDQAPEFVKIALCRFIQEALNNAFKHAGGMGQQIDIFWDGMRIEIKVEDDGPGIDGLSGLVREPGLGLAGLRDRIESIGGSVMMRSAPDAGTCISASLPLASEVSNAA